MPPPPPPSHPPDGPASGGAPPPPSDERPPWASASERDVAARACSMRPSCACVDCADAFGAFGFFFVALHESTKAVAGE